MLKKQNINPLSRDSTLSACARAVLDSGFIFATNIGSGKAGEHNGTYLPVTRNHNGTYPGKVGYQIFLTGERRRVYRNKIPVVALTFNNHA